MPSKPKLADPGALIRAGKLRTETVPVCLDPDLVGEHDALVERREMAKERARDSLAGGQVLELDEQIEQLVEQMRVATITLVFRALPRPEFRALMDKHPPRKDAEGKLLNPEDMLGVNFETFFNALLRVSLIEPVLDAETLDLLLDERLTDRQWQDITDVVWNLNRALVSVPFSQAVSPSRRNSSPR